MFEEDFVAVLRAMHSQRRQNINMSILPLITDRLEDGGFQEGVSNIRMLHLLMLQFARQWRKQEIQPYYHYSKRITRNSMNLN